VNPQPVILELPGGRARLEPLAAPHAEGLFSAGDDPECWRYTPSPRPSCVADTIAYMQLALDAQSRGEELPFAIIDRSTNTVAGTTRFLDIRRPHRTLEIGYTWLGAPWRRTSMNTECKHLLLRHAFLDLLANRVQLKTDARNLISQRAIERIGAVREGVLRKHVVMPDGYLRDSVMFSIIRDEWPEVERRLRSRLSDS